MDSCQDTRVRYKQELLTAKRLQYATFKQSEQTRKQFCKENYEPFIAKKFTYKSQKLSNGETILEHYLAVVIHCISIRKIGRKLSGNGLLRCSNIILK